MEMHVGGMLDYSTSLQNPNFAAMAEAIGIKGIRVESASTFYRVGTCKRVQLIHDEGNH